MPNKVEVLSFLLGCGGTERCGRSVGFWYKDAVWHWVSKVLSGVLMAELDSR